MKAVTARLGLTEAQMALLHMLERAYHEDKAAKVGPRTRWISEDGEPTASRMVARRLVATGLARFSHPDCKFLLITPPGRAVAQHRLETAA